MMVVCLAEQGGGMASLGKQSKWHGEPCFEFQYSKCPNIPGRGQGCVLLGSVAAREIDVCDRTYSKCVTWRCEMYFIEIHWTTSFCIYYSYSKVPFIHSHIVLKDFCFKHG